MKVIYVILLLLSYVFSQEVGSITIESNKKMELYPKTSTIKVIGFGRVLSQQGSVTFYRIGGIRYSKKNDKHNIEQIYASGKVRLQNNSYTILTDIVKGQREKTGKIAPLIFETKKLNTKMYNKNKIFINDKTVTVNDFKQNFIVVGLAKLIVNGKEKKTYIWTYDLKGDYLGSIEKDNFEVKTAYSNTKTYIKSGDISAEGDSAEYKNNIVTLMGNVKMTQGKNKLNGCKLTWDLEDEEANLVPCKAKELKGVYINEKK